MVLLAVVKCLGRHLEAWPLVHTHRIRIRVPAAVLVAIIIASTISGILPPGFFYTVEILYKELACYEIFSTKINSQHAPIFFLIMNFCSI